MGVQGFGCGAFALSLQLRATLRSMLSSSLSLESLTAAFMHVLGVMCKFWMQAADFLAVENHIQAICRELAKRLFAAEARRNTSIFNFLHRVPKKVLLLAFIPILGRWL
jgi:hypothetical protein